MSHEKASAVKISGQAKEKEFDKLIGLNDEYKNEDYISVVNDIVYNDILANKDMSSRQIPSKFKFRTSMPQTKNGKMDFYNSSNHLRFFVNSLCKYNDC